MREDRSTNSEADAGKFERVFGDADRYDDRPTRREIQAEEKDWSWDSNGAS